MDNDNDVTKCWSLKNVEMNKNKMYTFGFNLQPVAYLDLSYRGGGAEIQ